MIESRLYEEENRKSPEDPDENPIRGRKLITQPYDLGVTALMDQIDAKTLHLRPISDRPSHQRLYVWSDDLASKLIESILLNVPIPPCYLAQNQEFELDVIDGQQRIYSIYRFLTNRFRLKQLKVLPEYNGTRFFELPENLRRKIETYTLRCVVVTNDSDPDIKYEVFERLNSNTVPLNAQELRNSISRGSLMDLLGDLVEYEPWLRILNKKIADKRMRDEELILRFFAFQNGGPNNYHTPQKEWLNEAANRGRQYSEDTIGRLDDIWKKTVEKCLIVFEPEECFRRIPLKRRSVVNRALMDLTMYSLSDVPTESIRAASAEYYERYQQILSDDKFSDLITRAVDHKSRTQQRFEIWVNYVTGDLF